jgi:DNA primase
MAKKKENTRQASKVVKPINEMTEQEYQQWFEHQIQNAKPVKTQYDYIHGINVQNAEHLVMDCPMEGLKFEIMGGINLKVLDRLKATLKVSRLPQLSPIHAYRNTVDLYNDSQIKRYIRESAEKLELGTTDITNLVYSMIEGLETYRLDRRLESTLPKKEEKIYLTIQEKQEAMGYLQDENLLPVISTLLKTAGLVDEEENGLLLFLIFLTRDFEQPLHALIHGSSGSGKTNLLKTVINCIPDENVHITTALTENVLFYPPYKDFWKHKILMLEDLDGSISALYVLREFMSSGKITKFTTELDQTSGDLKQKKLSAEGPICIVGATTKEKIYEDNSNRSYLLHVDETHKHQQNVMDYQNKTAAGLVDKEGIKAVQDVLKNVQRCLDRKIEVRNPFQPELILPQVVFKPLRTNIHYITLIKAITYLHQHQLEVQTDKNGKQYVETKLIHIEWANKLCRESLLRKSDQLSGMQRTFFENLKVYLTAQGITEKDNKTFFASDIRKGLNLHPQMLKRNLKALELLELIEEVNYSKKLGFEYKILEWRDYETIKDSINSMDRILKDLKDKYPTA